MAEVISRRSIVYDILFEVEQGKKSAKEAEKALGGLDAGAGKLDASFKKLGGIISAAFAVDQIVDYTKQAVELAAKAEGVTRAFQKLNDATLLNDLRKATKGTIDDLTLMQAAVRADKFKIPMKELGGLFAFARQRARETGQEVKFLVDSIVDGIGRKSPLILDNLGLSATALQREFKKTGDFAKAAGEVIRKEMLLAGDQIETTADQFARFTANMDNLKLQVGNLLLPFINDFVEGLNYMNEAFSRSPNLIKDTVSELDKLRKGVSGGEIATEIQLTLLANLRQAYDDVVAKFGETDGAALELKTRIELLEASLDKAADEGLNGFNNRIDLLKESLNDLTGGGTGNLGILNEQLDDIKKRFVDTQNPIDFSAEQLKQYTQIIADLEAQIKALTEAQREAQETTFVPTKQIEQIKAIDQAIVKTAENTQGAVANTASAIEQLPEALREASDELANTFATLGQLAKDGSKAQVALSVVSVLAAQAEALAKGVAAAQSVPFPANLAAIATTVGTIAGIFVQIKSILGQAQAAESQVNAVAFAEGEIDIHRPGEKKGKDSIAAMIMPGESVMTTEETRQYKPILEAIRSGTLEDLIHQNYVAPELALNALDHAKNDSTELDYSERFYKQLLATGEGNSINKKTLNTLQRIEVKLGGNDYTKKYRR